jgi:ribosomal protein S18 acetylase RimI-like enzyme
MELRPVRREEAPTGLGSWGAVRLELAVAEHSQAAKALYRGLGFVPTGERRSMASDPTRAGVFMTRLL